MQTPPEKTSQPVGSHSDWFWEGNVQTQVVSHLGAAGWQIVRVASTATKEQGDDVVASRDGAQLVVEIKGYPSSKYADPRRASEVKSASATLQAHHWLADALIPRDAHSRDISDAG